MYFTTIIPWCQRPELAQSLRHNTPFFRAMGCEVIIVNCGGDAEMLKRMRAAPDLIETTQIDVPAERFNASRARNIGVHAAKADVLFFLDGDVLLPGDVRPHVDTCAEGRSYVTFLHVVNLPRKTLSVVKPGNPTMKTAIREQFMRFEWSDGQSTRLLMSSANYGRGSQLGPGQVMVRKQYVIEIDGFRSDLIGWGWEDLDFQLRLQRAGIAPIFVEEEIMHLEHGDNKRDLRKGETKKQLVGANMVRCIHSYCDGNFSGTYNADVAEWQAANRRAASLDGVLMAE
jgi:glycosyltransferase involved in cell wall biosynthesis